MIPFQSHAVSGVALSRFDGQYKILMMSALKETIGAMSQAESKQAKRVGKPSFANLPKRPK